MVDVYETFKKYGCDGDEDEFLNFKAVDPKYSNRSDLHAFILLDKLVPGDVDIISGASHDEIILSTSIESLSSVATEEDIRTLVRCGVMVNEEQEMLSMFV